MTFHADPTHARATMLTYAPPAAPLEMPQQVLERQPNRRAALPRLLPRLMPLRMARLMRLASPVLRLR